MSLEYKYCFRITRDEYEMIRHDMSRKEYRSVSMYVRDTMLGHHTIRPKNVNGKSSIADLSNIITDVTACLENKGESINRLARAVNMRTELTNAGTPVRFGGMAWHWSSMYEEVMIKLDDKLLDAIGSLMTYAKMHDIDYEKENFE